MANAVVIKDYSRQLMRKYKVAARRGLEVAAIQLVGDIRQDLGGGGPATAGGIGSDWFRGSVRMWSETKGKTTTRRRAVKAPSAPGSPPRKQTGRLARSVTHDFTDIMRGVVRVGSNLLYARGMELGTSPHVILPVEAKMLAWPGKWQTGKGGKISGEMIFARKVSHPGTAPRPFIRPAFDRMVAGKRIERAIRAQIKAMKTK